MSTTTERKTAHRRARPAILVAMPSLTVADYIADWLELQRSRLQPSTWYEYEGNVRRYLLPHVGHLDLTEVTPARINRLYADLLRRGGLRNKPLSLTTVRRFAGVLHKAMADAVDLELLDRNPANRASVPRIDRRGPRELQVWTADQLRTFLQEQRGTPLWPVWVVAAGTGMRRGEILGLRWRDVDLDRRTLHVRRALSVVSGTARLKVPKTSRARSLRFEDTVAEALKLRRAQQRHEEEGLPPPNERPESASWGLVFTEPDGGYIRPQKVTDTWRERVRESGLPVIRFHDVRHSHATLLLEAGVSPQVVSARLGHANIKTTLDVYAEVLPAMDEEAAIRFEDHVWGDRP